MFKSELSGKLALSVFGQKSIFTKNSFQSNLKKKRKELTKMEFTPKSSNVAIKYAWIQRLGLV